MSHSTTYKLGRSAYTSLRHYLKQKITLPAHHKVMQHKNSIMPMIRPASDAIGVSLISIIDSVQIHFQWLITHLMLKPGIYTMTAKEGLDGSGRHVIYDQKGNVETHNMILWMWVPIDVSMDLHEQTCTTEVRVVWCGGKVLPIVLMLLNLSSLQWERKTKSC